MHLYDFYFLYNAHVMFISVCSDFNHVRSWSVTRFRGMINTQPGSVPLASFKGTFRADYDIMTSHTSYDM